MPKQDDAAAQAQRDKEAKANQPTKDNDGLSDVEREEVKDHERVQQGQETKRENLPDKDPELGRTIFPGEDAFVENPGEPGARNEPV